MQLCRKKQIIHRPSSQQGAVHHAKNMPSASEYFQQSTYLNPRTIMTAMQKKLEDNNPSQQHRSDQPNLIRNKSATSSTGFISTNQATYQRKDFGIAKPNLDFLKPSAQQQKQWNYPPDILASQYAVDYKNKMKQKEQPKDQNGQNAQLRKARSVKFIDEVQLAKEREAEIKQQKLKTFNQASQYQYDYIHRKEILKHLDYSSDEENEKQKQKLKQTNANKSSTGILLNPFKPVSQNKQRSNAK